MESAAAATGIPPSIERVLRLELRPGLYVAGKIKKGIAKVGDILTLEVNGRAVGEVHVEGIEMMDFQIGGPAPSTLVTLRISGPNLDEVATGSVLRSG